MANKDTVCVTGASGFIGSWVVRLLLEGGYTVHATAQDLGNDKETKHLEAMEGAKERLKLFQLDLLDYGSAEAAISGCDGVFHLASPCIVDEVKDPQAQLLDPAIKGTKNVLEAAHKAKVKRVVLTSSTSAIIPSPNWPADVPRDENCWADLDYCQKNGIWYPASKTLAEKAAWDFAKETGLDVVVINPGTVLGTIFPPAINASMGMFLRLLQGCTDGFANLYMGCVHVKDVAKGHILLYETPSASGRHLCVEATTHWSDFADMVARLYPEYKVHRFTEVTQPGLLRVLEKSSKKLIDLGLIFTPMEQVIKDSVTSLKEKGFLN
uniref:NAD-dependent epimerase/dehydratase domain-containing protein n=1 Tax=Araucaria cunninghamii TaxID=56994 RepID=A0A0D6R9R2_ARACU